MSQVRLSDLSIKNLAPGMYWDQLLPSFGVRIGARRKTFILMHGKARNKLRIGHYPALTLSEARAKARHRIEAFDAASGQAEANPVVSEAVSEYLASLTCRPRTKREYTRLLNRHLIPGYGSKLLGSITSRQITNIIDGLSATPTERLHTFTALSPFFTWAVQRHYIPISPMHSLKQPKPSPGRERILSADELKKIWLATGTADPFDCIIRLCILTGQRRGELAQLRPEWITEEALTIPSQIAKNGEEMSLPLTPQTRPLILALSSMLSKPYSDWHRPKQRLDAGSGITGWTIHDLRRTFATILASLETPPHIIEAILNHKTGTIRGVARIYNRYRYRKEMAEALLNYEAHLTKIIAS